VPVVRVRHRDHRSSCGTMGWCLGWASRVRRHQPHPGGVRPLSGLLASVSRYALTPVVAPAW